MKSPRKKVKIIKQNNIFSKTTLLIGVLLLVGVAFAVSISYLGTPTITGATTIRTCTDSDSTTENNGIDPSVRGGITWTSPEGKTRTKQDQCVGNILAEWYCNEEKLGRVKELPCEGGCSEGVCVITAEEDDETDETEEETEPEETIEPTTVLIETCIDTDEGKNFRVRGMAITKSKTIVDKCKDPRKLVEALCSGTSITKEEIDCKKLDPKFECITIKDKGYCGIPTSQKKCKDNDGLDITKRSKVTWDGINHERTIKEDFCRGNDVVEWYCPNHIDLGRPKQIACPSGMTCINGACKIPVEEESE